MVTTLLSLGDYGALRYNARLKPASQTTRGPHGGDPTGVARVWIVQAEAKGTRALVMMLKWLRPLGAYALCPASPEFCRALQLRSSILGDEEDAQLSSPGFDQSNPSYM
ncbi:hypothetical protein PC116_g11636 [Phytophthora cactorum]|nr:hypothetical protein PC116_g11636 [Phytophthora cactorum]